MAVWIYLVTHATPLPYDTHFGGEAITLQPGQLITSRKSIAESFNRGLKDNTVQKVLEAFEKAQLIEQRTCNQNRLITLKNWNVEQKGEQRNEQRNNNEITTDEQQMNTYREDREDKEDKESDFFDRVGEINYLD